MKRSRQLFPCDILCVTESHCQEMQNTKDILPGYVYNGRSRQECYSHGTANCLTNLKTAAKGGVGIFISNHLLSTDNVHEVDYWFQDISIEHTGISVSDPKKGTFNIICMYRPPKLPLGYFCAEASKLLSRIAPESSTIIVGDFNVDGCVTQQPIQKMFSNNGYKQLIYKPTTCDKNGATLDHMYISESIAHNHLLSVNSGVIPTHYSFHEATYLSF